MPISCSVSRLTPVAVTRKARDTLVSMDLRGAVGVGVTDVVRRLKGANTVQRLNLVGLPDESEGFGEMPDVETIKELLALSSARVKADVACSAEEASAILRQEPPFANFKAHTVVVRDGPTCAPGARALVDAALGSSLSGLNLWSWGDVPVGPRTTEICRLLRDGHIASLSLTSVDDAINLVPPEQTAEFCTALGACRLKSLRFQACGLLEGGSAVVDALVAHPTVRSLSLENDFAGGGVGEGLARLLAADTLTDLTVSSCGLGDGSVRMLLAALSSCTTLRSLDLSSNNLSAAFVLDELAVAVAANKSLRKLRLDTYPSTAELAQVEALVGDRV